MKKQVAILLVLFLILTSCGTKEKESKPVEWQTGQVTEEVTEQSNVASNDESSKSNTVEKTSTAIEGKSFDGKKGIIPVKQELERYGIRITFDYLLFDDEKGLFDPPPEGFIFMYPVLTLKNERDDGLSIDFASSSSCVATVDGKEYTRSMDALLSYSGKEMSTLDTTIDVGEIEQVHTGMVIPEDWKEIRFLVSQIFDAQTPPVNMIFEVKRDSGTAKEIQLLEAKNQEIPSAAPRLSPENYLNVKEIEEITGLYNVGEVKPNLSDSLSQVDYILHADPDGSPDSLKSVELQFDLYYAKDELTYDQWNISGSKDTFDRGRKSNCFLEDVPNLGDDAYWRTSLYGNYSELCVLVNNDTYGPYLISLAINENGDKEILIPLAERTILNLKKLNDTKTN